jgi:hypothetical protein
VSDPQKKYRPSNGTEGEMFMAEFCARCVRDAAFRAGEKGANGCDIIVRAMCFDVDDPAYPVEWTHDWNGEPTCTDFQEIDP